MCAKYKNYDDEENWHLEEYDDEEESEKLIDSTSTYIIDCIDLEDNLKSLLEYIREIGNEGHSFRIIVAPGDPELEQDFFWDGENDDFIEDIIIEK